MIVIQYSVHFPTLESGDFVPMMRHDSEAPAGGVLPLQHSQLEEQRFLQLQSQLQRGVPSSFSSTVKSTTTTFTSSMVSSASYGTGFITRFISPTLSVPGTPGGGLVASGLPQHLASVSSLSANVPLSSSAPQHSSEQIVSDPDFVRS